MRPRRWGGVVDVGNRAGVESLSMKSKLNVRGNSGHLNKVNGLLSTTTQNGIRTHDHFLVKAFDALLNQRVTLYELPILSEWLVGLSASSALLVKCCRLHLQPPQLQLQINTAAAIDNFDCACPRNREYDIFLVVATRANSRYRVYLAPAMLLWYRHMGMQFGPSWSPVSGRSSLGHIHYEWVWCLAITFSRNIRDVCDLTKTEVTDIVDRLSECFRESMDKQDSPTNATINIQKMQ
ncbi:hypothetical protein BDD12DRAFT_801486 [Trichophaea hybrida]|nr:hypothetical protein BDD12DRAFT_801486 [Trichophaea hybrida]